MRTFPWLAILLACLSGTAPAWGQRTLTPLSGGAPRQTVNVPLNMNNAIVPPVPVPQASPFSLTHILQKLSLPGVRPRTVASPLPGPGAFPSTKYPNGLPHAVPQQQRIR